MDYDVIGEGENDKLVARTFIPIAVISVSFAAIFIRWSDSHPITVAFYRMLFSSGMLLIFVPPYLSQIKRFKKKEWLTLITTGLFLAVHFAAWISSLDYTSVASSVVLVTAHPIVVAWISSWYLGEKTSSRAYIGIAIGLVGVFVMTFSNYRISGWALIGDMLAIVGMLAFAGYLLRGRKLRQDMSVVPYAFMVYLFSTIFLGIFSIPFSASFAIYPMEEYVLFLALALVPTIFGHTLFNWALKHVKARVVSVSLLGEPIGSSVLAFLILKEVPPDLTLIGGAITLFGIYLCAKYE